jgi:hypothetical protein
MYGSMHVCMYVCMYGSMHACMYVCSLEALIIQDLCGPMGAVLKELLLRLYCSL